MGSYGATIGAEKQARAMRTIVTIPAKASLCLRKRRHIIIHGLSSSMVLRLSPSSSATAIFQTPKNMITS
jgi:hypothetical protein